MYGLVLRAISSTLVQIRRFSCSNFCGAQISPINVRVRKPLILLWWARQDSNLQPDRYERQDIDRFH
jgi:hypothetical protein